MEKKPTKEDTLKALMGYAQTGELKAQYDNGVADAKADADKKFEDALGADKELDFRLPENEYAEWPKEWSGFNERGELARKNWYKK